MELFDAHDHLQNYAAGAELESALGRASAAGVKFMLCCGTGPEDWPKVLDLVSGRKNIFPCFGLHPWFADKAGPGWLELLGKFLARTPSCVGEIGLDKAAAPDLGGQKEIFREQLRLAKSSRRPAVIHCVKAWSELTDIIKEERPPAFMLHAYGGPAEMTGELARLGAYFSFGPGIMDPARKKMRKALLSVPSDRVLFETESPGPGVPGGGPGPAELVKVISAAAAQLGTGPEALGDLSRRNAEVFLGKIFSERK